MVIMSKIGQSAGNVSKSAMTTRMGIVNVSRWDMKHPQRILDHRLHTYLVNMAA
jgi:hypothetical protein